MRRVKLEKEARKIIAPVIAMVGGSCLVSSMWKFTPLTLCHSRIRNPPSRTRHSDIEAQSPAQPHPVATRSVAPVVTTDPASGEELLEESTQEFLYFDLLFYLAHEHLIAERGYIGKMGEAGYMTETPEGLR